MSYEIGNSMGEQRDLIGDLYLLRGGISLMAQKADEIKSKEQERDTKKEKLKKERLLYDGLTAGDLSKKSECDNFIEDLYDDLEHNENKLANSKHEFGKCNVAPFMLLAVVIGLVILSIYLIVMVFKRGEAYYGGSLFFCVIGTFAFLIVCLIGFGATIFLITEVFEDCLYGKICKLKTDIKHIKHDIAIVWQIHGKFKEYDIICQNAVEPIAEQIKIIFNIFNKQFGATIDYRDWKYLDLIIFYLQTGRADTMKEALYQVDRQVQADTIVNAVDGATKAICGTIVREIGTLGAMITSRLDLMIAQNKVMIAQNKVRIAQNDLNNALVAYNAQSSSAIMKTIKSFFS